MNGVDLSGLADDTQTAVNAAGSAFDNYLKYSLVQKGINPYAITPPPQQSSPLTTTTIVLGVVGIGLLFYVLSKRR